MHQYGVFNSWRDLEKLKKIVGFNSKSSFTAVLWKTSLFVYKERNLRIRSILTWSVHLSWGLRKRNVLKRVMHVEHGYFPI